MLSFKKFLYEAPRKKSVQEPDWPDADYASGFAKLRDMQKNYDVEMNGKLQLFVPKHRDPAVELERQRSNRYIRTKNELDKEERAKLKEEKAPLLSAFHESPPGNNKPDASFWTSTAIDLGNGIYTSDWYNYVRRNFKGWQTDYGYLFEVQGDPLIFNITYAEYYYEWALDQKRIKLKKAEYYDEYSMDDARHRFPWDSLAQHFDGISCQYPSRGYSRDEFDQGWDVESTAWFKTGFLKYKGAVRLPGKIEDYDDNDD